jgi:undecaprenyl phosphate N,N'-diacetylbacillosamine 1-phosphate transferase
MMYKFRTMTDEREKNGELLPDSIRLAKFGRFLRSTPLDELPELFNILKGDMSIIGPRPLLVRYLPLYNEHQKRRHEVRPGLSGLAQVSGRNAISLEEKFNLDVKYVDNVSFLGDWTIIFLTIKKVLYLLGKVSTQKLQLLWILLVEVKDRGIMEYIVIIGAGEFGREVAC